MVSRLLILNLFFIFSNAFPGWKDKQKEKLNMLRIKLPSYKPIGSIYNPRRVDWAGVVSGCKAACRFEKRLCNFYIRAAAHDALSVSEGYGGADGSLLLTEDELRRSENRYDNFAFILSKNALALAKKYDASVADIIAVCGAVSSEYLGGPKVLFYDKSMPFLVGRLDKQIPNPANSLAPANLNTSGFSDFTIKRNLSIEEMVALMGSHSLIDEKSCLKHDNTFCDPHMENCDNISMFTYDNLYFKEMCNPKIEIYNPPVYKPITINKTFEVKQELCKFTSNFFRNNAVEDINNEINIDSEPEFEKIDVEWVNPSRTWKHTVNDAWLGKACQKDLVMTDYNQEINIAMNKFKNSLLEWHSVYSIAYKKMINIGAQWAIQGGYAISGIECKSYRSLINKINCRLCNMDYFNFLKRKCDDSCKCFSSFADNDIFYE
jgi:hypothetical protein